MKSIKTRSKEGNGIIAAIGIGQGEYPPEKEEEQHSQDYEQGKSDNVEPAGDLPPAR